MRRIPVLLAALALACAPAHSQTAREYAVKASFISKFISFVQWPGPKPDPDGPEPEPFTVSVVGDNPFREELERALRAADLGGRTPVVRVVDDVEDLDGSQIVFIGGEEKARVERVVSWARGHGALTIGDGEGYASRGVMINFFLDHAKVRFEINPTAAERGGFQISSLLLKVARIVEQP